MNEEKRWLNKYLTEKQTDHDTQAQVDELSFVVSELMDVMKGNKPAIKQLKVIKREVSKLQGIY